jgi:hypothetical protein
VNWIGHRWVQVFAAWALLAVALSYSAIANGNAPRVTGDDAMRLVAAIDLFNGQSWFDTTQYRDNTPFGAPMHWSRLIDAPLVLLIALFKPFAAEAAPYWAAFVWPLIVLFAVVALLADLAERMAGKAARIPALAMLALSIAIYTEFIPGRVDHHNVQIALTLAMITSSLQGRSSTLWAVAAGFIAATGLAIGTEVLPAVLAVLICFSLYWLVEPERSRPYVLALAASFPASLMLHIVLVTRPDAWLSSACDALSTTYVVAGVCYGAAMLLAVLFASLLRHWSLRLLGLAVLAVLSAAAVFWFFPECRNGPYGNLDANLAAILFPEIGEAQTIWTWAGDLRPFRPEMALLVTPLVGMAILLLVTAKVGSAERWRWLVLAGFCGALFVVFCLQIRGFRLLTIALLPGTAWLALRVWEWFRVRQTVASAVITGVALSAMTGALQWSLFTYAYAAFVPKTPDISMINWDKCLEREAYEPLAALPPGRLMSFMLIGPQLLLETPHSIVSAGYHRNEAGLRDLIRFYAGGEAEARSVARERGLDYLVFCSGLPANGGLAGVPDFQGTSWSWLVRLSPPDAPLQIYSIE